MALNVLIQKEGENMIQKLTEEQTVEIVNKKRKRPGRTEELIPHTEPGEMSAMIRNALTLSSFGDVDTNDPEQVEQRIKQYYSYCVDNDIRPSALQGLLYGDGEKEARAINQKECETL